MVKKESRKGKGEQEGSKHDEGKEEGGEKKIL
jgi:hypothetical protein